MRKLRQSSVSIGQMAVDLGGKDLKTSAGVSIALRHPVALTLLGKDVGHVGRVPPSSWRRAPRTVCIGPALSFLLEATLLLQQVFVSTPATACSPIVTPAGCAGSPIRRFMEDENGDCQGRSKLRPRGVNGEDKCPTTD